MQFQGGRKLRGSAHYRTAKWPASGGGGARSEQQISAVFARKFRPQLLLASDSRGQPCPALPLLPGSGRASGAATTMAKPVGRLALAAGAAESSLAAAAVAAATPPVINLIFLLSAPQFSLRAQSAAGPGRQYEQRPGQRSRQAGGKSAVFQRSPPDRVLLERTGSRRAPPKLVAEPSADECHPPSSIRWPLRRADFWLPPTPLAVPIKTGRPPLAYYRRLV